MKRILGALVAFLFLVTGCSATSSQDDSEEKRDEWVTDSVDSLIEFSYPAEYEEEGNLFGRRYTHFSWNFDSVVSGDHSPDKPQDFDYIRFNFFANLKITERSKNVIVEDPENITIDGHKALKIPYALKDTVNDDLGSRGFLLIVQIDNSTSASVATFIRIKYKVEIGNITYDKNEPDIDKVYSALDKIEKSIKVID